MLIVSSSDRGDWEESETVLVPGEVLIPEARKIRSQFPVLAQVAVLESQGHCGLSLKWHHTIYGPSFSGF